MARPHPEAFEPFFAMVSVRDTLSDAERHTVLAAAGEVRSFAPGEDIVDQGERPSSSTLLTRGMTARYSIHPTGESAFFVCQCCAGAMLWELNYLCQRQADYPSLFGNVAFPHTHVAWKEILT